MNDVERLKSLLRADPVTGLSESRRLGRYRLGEVLGEGGMGVVFRAYDEKLGRDVALKMLKTAQIHSPEAIGRFRREAQNAGKLQHPGIVAVHDVDELGEALFYTMELVEGRVFDPRAGTLEARIATLEKVARAVHYAHVQGVIHRDLKPANILIDAAGEPHLLDFGLSRDLLGSAQLSKAGAVLGTPAYMAPEQGRQSEEPVSGLSDVYALGTILYEVLAGRVPFQGETWDVLTRLQTEEPAPPAGPRDLAAAARKAMEKNPRHRYPSAETFAEDLRRFLEGRPLEARPLGLAVTLWRKFRRSRVVAVALLVALSGGLGLGIWLGKPAPVAGTVLTPQAGGKAGTPFTEIREGSTFLRGFRLAVVTGEHPQVIVGLRAIYDTEPDGPLRGAADGPPMIDVRAKPGYALGGMRLYATNRVHGINLTFMRRIGDRLDPGDRYESGWIGDEPRVTPVELGGTGEPLRGICGRVDTQLVSLGLVLVP